MIEKAVKVLLVEHDASLARSICTSLSCEHTLVFKVAWVQEISKALELIESTHIDIVLFDLSIGNEDSADIVKQLLFRSPRAIVILLCSHTDRVIAMQAMAQGAYDCIDRKSIGHNWIKRVVGYNLLLEQADELQAVADAKLHAIGRASSLGIVVSNLDGNITYTNPAFQAIIGYSATQHLEQQWKSLIHPLDRLRLERKWRDALNDQLVFSTEVRLLKENTNTCRVRLTRTLIQADSKLYGHLTIVEELTDSAYVSLSSSTQHNRDWLSASTAQITLDVMADAVLSTDARGNVVYLNQAAMRLTGWHSLEAVGHPLAEVFNLKDPDKVDSIVDVLKSESESVLLRKDGVETIIEESTSPIFDQLGHVSGSVLVFRDVTQSRAMATKMIHLAQHDCLTDLPNRSLLKQRLDHALVLAKRHEKRLAVLYLDIDLFKQVNDRYGHKCGDQLLSSLANRMTSAVRRTDTVSRQGGDEFVILLTEIEDLDDASKLARKLLSSLSSPHVINGKVVTVTLSIGISLYPDDGETGDILIDSADRAMFQAKSNGHNGFKFFKKSLQVRASKRSQMDTRLRRALLKHEFIVHYQPQIDLTSGAVTSAEALIRWEDPDYGLLFPSEFIRMSEQAKLICAIGDWVRFHVCQQQKKWLENGLDIVPIMINTAAIELCKKHFLNDIELTLNEAGIAAHFLGLEISESDIEGEAFPIIRSLKSIGVRLGIDDVGVNESGMNYLQRMDFDTVKIAPKVINEAIDNTGKATIARAIIGLGNNLGQQTVAKHVENQQQLTFLRQCGCIHAQGNFFKHPVAPDIFAKLLSHK